MPKVGDVFGVYGYHGFRPYLGSSAINGKSTGLVNWQIREPLDRPLRPGDLVFFHATRQRDKLDGAELEIKSEAGEFLPGFYTTSGTSLIDSIKRGWYWYECPDKTSKPKSDWHVIAFVLRKAYVDHYLTSLFARDTCLYYLQEPRRFRGGGDNFDAKELAKIEFANKNSQVMIFPDKTTKVTCGRNLAKVSLEEFVEERECLGEMANYSVIVGLQKPPPLDMRQQCWVSPDGLWHINQAERYVVFDRTREGLADIQAFVDENSQSSTVQSSTGSTTQQTIKPIGKPSKKKK